MNRVNSKSVELCSNLIRSTVVSSDLKPIPEEVAESVVRRSTKTSVLEVSKLDRFNGSYATDEPRAMSSLVHQPISVGFEESLVALHEVLGE